MLLTYENGDAATHRGNRVKNPLWLNRTDKRPLSTFTNLDPAAMLFCVCNPARARSIAHLGHWPVCDPSRL
jgi:hypothetical protein